MKSYLQKKVVVVVVVLAALSGYVFYNQSFKTTPPGRLPSNRPIVDQNDRPKIISTKPDPLEEAIISANEVIELTFNRPLENEGELKIRFDPKIDFEIKLSQDRKTGKIITKTPYELGATYTLFIGPDSKFEGVGEWKQEKIFHFKTVRYRGV